jgi:hypothetical protein
MNNIYVNRNVMFMLINYIQKGFKGNQEGIYIYADKNYKTDEICYKLNEFFNIKNDVINDELYSSIFYYYYNDIQFGINLNANDKINNTIHIWISG